MKSGDPNSTDPVAYDRVFWLGYFSNGLVTLANAMMFRYADFVNVLGGKEGQFGLIVGFGMVGSIVMRLLQGEGIDRYGPGKAWRWSMLIYSCALFTNLFLGSAYGAPIFIVRLLMQTSLAGVFGASITFVSLRVPPGRMAEVIGTLGTSGFLGIMVGPLIGDWLCNSTPILRNHVDRIFVFAGTVSMISTAAAWLATRHEVVPRPRRRPPLIQLVRKYAPFLLSLVAAAMGAGFAIPMNFLRPFARDLEIPHVGLFFTVYAIVAFIARISTRQMFERFGNRPWIALGTMLLALSFLFYIPARAVWHLTFPAAIAGVAHALMFPAVMAAGTSLFPRRYLGVSTSLMLAMFDFGTFVSSPIFGGLLEFRKRQLATDAVGQAYAELFLGAFAVLLVIAVAYCFNRTESPAEGVSNQTG